MDFAVARVYQNWVVFLYEGAVRKIDDLMCFLAEVEPPDQVYAI